MALHLLAVEALQGYGSHEAGELVRSFISPSYLTGVYTAKAAPASVKNQRDTHYSVRNKCFLYFWKTGKSTEIGLVNRTSGFIIQSIIFLVYIFNNKMSAMVTNDVITVIITFRPDGA